MSDTATKGRWVPVAERMPGEGRAVALSLRREPSILPKDALWSWDGEYWHGVNHQGVCAGEHGDFTHWFDPDAAPVDPLQQLVADYLAARKGTHLTHTHADAARRAVIEATKKEGEALAALHAAYGDRHPGDYPLAVQMAAHEIKLWVNPEGPVYTARLLTPPTT